jgi:putative FmdB family regulatory protein
MPTYEYVCRSCKHEFETFQSMTESPKRTCPKCGKSALERKIGLGAAVLFKGSGFYQTDYRSDSYKKGAEAEKPSTDKKADTKSDAKPEKPAKAESKTKTESKPESKSSKPKSKE